MTKENENNEYLKLVYFKNCIPYYDDDVYLDKLQTMVVKKPVLYM
jgi:hypothetical protein